MVSFHGQNFFLHLHHLHEGSVAIVSVHQPLVLVLLVHLEVDEHQVRAQDLPAVSSALEAAGHTQPDLIMSLISLLNTTCATAQSPPTLRRCWAMSRQSAA